MSGTRSRNGCRRWRPRPTAWSSYFAGHGFVQNGRGYLAPTDVDPRRLSRGDGVSHDGARRHHGEPRAGRLEGAPRRLVPLRQDKRGDDERGARPAVQQPAGELPDPDRDPGAGDEPRSSRPVDGVRVLHLLPDPGLAGPRRQRPLRRADHGRRGDRLRPGPTCGGTPATGSSPRRRRHGATTTPPCCSASAPLPRDRRS